MFSFCPHLAPSTGPGAKLGRRAPRWGRFLSMLRRPTPDPARSLDIQRPDRAVRNGVSHFIRSYGGLSDHVTTTRTEARLGSRRDVACTSPSAWDSTRQVAK